MDRATMAARLVYLICLPAIEFASPVMVGLPVRWLCLESQSYDGDGLPPQSGRAGR